MLLQKYGQVKGKDNVDNDHVCCVQESTSGVWMESRKKRGRL
jgi:hypothetical protein